MVIRAVSCLVALLELATPASAEDCRLALVLALDVSSSVDLREDRLQREGLAHALLAPEVVRAALTGDPVAIFVFEWASGTNQVDITPGWQWVRSEEDLVQVAGLVATSQRRIVYHTERSTALGAALIRAADALEEVPDCNTQIIDIAGDGQNNAGPEPQDAYAGQRFERTTVNALVVRTALSRLSERQGPGELVAYFHTEVLHGPGAFCMVARGYEDYERAIRAKLVRELEAPLVSGLPVALGGA